MLTHILFAFVSIGFCCSNANDWIPIVVNTWAFTNATEEAWRTITMENGTALDGVERGCSKCEEQQCDGTVGWGGSPDESGETTLDAMIMDGETHDIGAVGDLRRIKNAISVARRVLENTEQTFLVGDQANQFAQSMGFREESLTSNRSRQIYHDWIQESCQPNYWRNVEPDPRSNCGPYRPIKRQAPNLYTPSMAESIHKNHDTIGMVVIDRDGRIAAGTSTNGLSHKIAGRVGDSPIPGSGAYVEKETGSAAATGDGDVMMRFLPAYQAIVNLRLGFNPWKAAKEAIGRIAAIYPKTQAAIIVVNKRGEFGAACHGFDKFPFSVMRSDFSEVTVLTTNCTKALN
ncbi:N(4)-(Beta-N-acetylglucosaminyl)-L-asparaginase-like [Brevipalpus obovatus]|uniref:N(4)-(Beta-N-acetylglucosaminyl)-L-asparaginase- like n=1 Tax=Brevipalpus obovatus TaxID=246614 RepID=UPI003D9ED525